MLAPSPCVRACLIRIYIDFIMVSCTSWLMPKAGMFHYIFMHGYNITYKKKIKHRIFMTYFFFFLIDVADVFIYRRIVNLQNIKNLKGTG